MLNRKTKLKKKTCFINILHRIKTYYKTLSQTKCIKKMIKKIKSYFITSRYYKLVSKGISILVQIKQSNQLKIINLRLKLNISTPTLFGSVSQWKSKQTIFFLTLAYITLTIFLLISTSRIRNLTEKLINYLKHFIYLKLIKSSVTILFK